MPFDALWYVIFWDEERPSGFSRLLPILHGSGSGCKFGLSGLFTFVSLTNVWVPTLALALVDCFNTSPFDKCVVQTLALVHTSLTARA